MHSIQHREINPQINVEWDSSVPTAKHFKDQDSLKWKIPKFIEYKCNCYWFEKWKRLLFQSLVNKSKKRIEQLSKQSMQNQGEKLAERKKYISSNKNLLQKKEEKLTTFFDQQSITEIK